MMRLSLLPPLMALCADLLLQKPPPITALPLPQPHSEQSGQLVSSGRPSNKLFHPPTGSCVLRKSMTDPLMLGPCDLSDAWAYTPQKFLVVKGTYFCLQAVNSGEPARLSIICSESDSQWEVSSNAKPQLSTKLPNGSSLCLDVGFDNTLITNPCARSSNGARQPDGQWFEFTTKNKEVDAKAP